jgi:hypothetical protein
MKIFLSFVGVGLGSSRFGPELVKIEAKRLFDNGIPSMSTIADDDDPIKSNNSRTTRCMKIVQISNLILHLLFSHPQRQNRQSSRF